jgi:hypothetical protein
MVQLARRIATQTNDTDDSDHFVFDLSADRFPPWAFAQFGASDASTSSAGASAQGAGLRGAPTAGNPGDPEPTAGSGADSNDPSLFGGDGSGGTSVAVAASGNAQIDGLLSGTRWSSAITYSNPDAAADYQAGYVVDRNGNGTSAQNEGFAQISASQLLAVHFALNQAIYTQPVGAGGFSVEGFTNLGIDFAGAGTGAATLRYANTSDNSTGYGLFPANNIYGGDGWLGTSIQSPIQGNYGWNNTIHEIGHTLGLKHAHETGGPGNTAVPSNMDSLEFTVMTYRSYVGGPLTGYTNETYGYPQTYMMLDIQALQYMYGADFTSNSGDTVYTWSPTTGQAFVNGALALNPGGNRIFETIWDGNGNDTYDLSNYTTSLNVDLTPGGYSTFSTAQRAYLGGGPNGGYARGEVFNALQFNGDARSLIENAIGGSGNDTFRGNAADNTLNGNGGTDTVVFAQNRSAYAFTESNNHNYTTVATGEGTDTLQSIEQFQFADVTVTDDLVGGSSTAASVAVGGTATGNHQFTGDSDWFSTTLVAGHNYIIRELGSPTGQGTLADTLVKIHDSSGTLLFTDDDNGVGFSSELAVHSNSGGTYYVDAGGFTSSLGTYTVGVQDLGVGSASSHFQSPNGLALNVFGTSLGAGGWASENGTPRLLGDANGDDLTDIYGFGASGVYIAHGHSGATFDNATFALAAFGADASAGGWSSQNEFPRAIANVGGSTLSDIVGFGGAGVYVALATGTDTFGPGQLTYAGFGSSPSGGGWSSQDLYPRVLGDVNGDGLADIVGFGSAGTYVAFGTGNGNFGAAISNPGIFGSADIGGGWTSFDRYPRALADVNGDGKADIVGFGGAGVYVALADPNGDGHFQNAFLAINSFGASDAGGGWSSQNLYPRELADTNGDGRADIVAFGSNGVYIATAKADGTFNAATFDLQGYGAGDAGGGWNSQDSYPRLLADLTGDHVSDIIAFGVNGVYASPDYNFHIV